MHLFFYTNVHGSSSANTQATYTAADAPTNVQNLIVTIDGTSSVIIDWVTPSSNNGSPISAYTIKIKKSGTFTLVDQGNCSENVLSNTKCTLTQTYVKSTYSLNTGDQVEAEVLASNARGDSSTVTATSSNTLP